MKSNERSHLANVTKVECAAQLVLVRDFGDAVVTEVAFVDSLGKDVMFSLRCELLL